MEHVCLWNVLLQYQYNVRMNKKLIPVLFILLFSMTSVSALCFNPLELFCIFSKDVSITQEEAIDTDCIEFRVATGDNIFTKKNISLWTDEDHAEWDRANMRQGYIIDKKFCGESWGNMETLPNHAALVRIKAIQWNESWLEPVYKTVIDPGPDDLLKEIVQLRKYRFPLETELPTKMADVDLLIYNEIVSWNITEDYTEKNISQTIELVNKSDMPEVKNRHGSSGTFTICPSGCNYTSIAAFESAQNSDLTGTGPAIAIINESFEELTATINIDGWTTTLADYIMIQTVGEARHNGTFNTSFHFLNITTDGGRAIDTSESFVHFDGLQVWQNTTTSGADGFFADADITSAQYNWTSNILISMSVGLNADGFVIDGSGNLYLANNFVYGYGKACTFASASGSDVVNLVVVADTYSRCGDSTTLPTGHGGVVLRTSSTGNANGEMMNVLSVNNTGQDYATDGAGIETLNVTFSIDSDASIAAEATFQQNNTASVSIFNSDQGAGNNVIFINTTSQDFRLQDLNNTNNVAQDAHDNFTSFGLPMVLFDIANTTRPQNTNFDIGSFEVIAAGDGPPTFSSIAVNSTVAGQSTNFSIIWDDDVALHPKGQYIFSTNNTGVWINDSAINFTTTPSAANVIKVLNSTEGTVVGYRWFATDNITNTNDTGIQILTTTSADSCSPTSPLTGNHLFNCADDCIQSTNLNAAGFNISIIGFGSFTLTANITGYTQRIFAGANESSKCIINGFGGWFQS